MVFTMYRQFFGKNEVQALRRKRAGNRLSRNCHAAHRPGLFRGATASLRCNFGLHQLVRRAREGRVRRETVDESCFQTVAVPGDGDAGGRRGRVNVPGQRFPAGEYGSQTIESFPNSGASAAVRSAQPARFDARWRLSRRVAGHWFGASQRLSRRNAG